MNSNENEGPLPWIGYLYQQAGELFRMEINISPEPTREHFDVLRAHFPLEESPGCPGQVVVSHPWIFDSRARVCPGVVILEDRLGEKEEAFTFGGHLTIETRKQYTVCELLSRAPILKLTQGSDLSRFLFEEIEILLAVERARFADLEEYQERICAFEPGQLYRACLVSVRDRIREMEQVDRRCRELEGFLQDQLHHLGSSEQDGAAEQTLEELFQSG